MMPIALEDALADLEHRMVEPEKLANAVLSRLKRARRMAALGDLGGIAAQLDQAPEAGERLVAALRELPGSLAYDVEAAFQQGDYLEELKAEAARQGVILVDRDGRLSAFPLLLKLDAKAAGVRVGRKTQRAIRPSALVKSLKAAQQSSRFNAAGFLEQLWRAYQYLAPSPWKPDSGSDGPTVPLARVHALLTLHPAAASDYPRDAFASDLLRLNRSPDIATKGGWSFSLPAATGSKGSDRLTVYDESGREHIFYGIRFSAPATANGGAADGARA